MIDPNTISIRFAPFTSKLDRLRPDLAPHRLNMTLLRDDMILTLNAKNSMFLKSWQIITPDSIQLFLTYVSSILNQPEPAPIIDVE